MDTSKLALASRVPVIEALCAFAGHPVDQWLPQSHPASTGQFLKANGKPYLSYRDFEKRFSPEHVTEVLAATGPSHCIDGWTYLSRAMAALLSGDTHTARHLSYYAQLRAALSLLHCNGVGIFNGINFVVDANRSLHRIDTNSKTKRGLGTHHVTWPALRHWAADLQVARIFLGSVEFRGVSLLDCIHDVWPSALGAPLVSDVIEAWGVDLKRSSEEHESRSISSYCTHAFNPAKSDISTRLELVRELWLSLEPDGRGGFPSLDQHLLRRFLELMTKQQLKFSDQSKLWDTAFPNLDPQIKAFVSQKFLERSQEPTDLVVLTHADSTQPGDVHAMICRALLLLRTATSVVRKAFVDARFNPLANDAQLWFENVGIDRGFWPSSEQFDQADELWDVIGHAVEDLSEQMSTNFADQFSFLKTLKAQSVLLSQTERACMWGVSA